MPQIFQIKIKFGYKIATKMLQKLWQIRDEQIQWQLSSKYVAIGFLVTQMDVAFNVANGQITMEISSAPCAVLGY